MRHLFAAGFRPMFLAAGIGAAILIPLWVLQLDMGGVLRFAGPVMLWHVHEMVFGFLAAAIAGFMLTAVPGWTGRGPFAGWPLRLLLLLWFAGRVLLALSAELPAALVAAVDLAFMLQLAAMLATPLLRSRSRNTPLLGVLVLLLLCNLAFHISLAHGLTDAALRALRLAIDLIAVLATVIGGRIIPAFTASALRGDGQTVRVTSSPGLDRATILAMVLIAAADAIHPGGPWNALLAAVAAVLQLLRMRGWQGMAGRGRPILWILHAGYAWFPVALALKALALGLGVGWAAWWQHALTAGALATLVMGVMTRAALGHTGRALKVAPAVTLAYGLLLLAAVLRVFGPAFPSVPYVRVIGASAVAWTAAFLIFLTVYAPILLAARADGKPG